MADDLGLLGKVPPAQRQHIVLAIGDDGLPAAISWSLMGDHQMADVDLVPGRGRPGGGSPLPVTPGDTGIVHRPKSCFVNLRQEPEWTRTVGRSPPRAKATTANRVRIDAAY